MHGVQMVAALILIAAAFHALAKDVSREQSAVQYARQEFDKAEAEHKADATQAAKTSKALAALKKQLEQEQEKAKLSASRQQQARQKLDQAEQALDRAWKQ